MVLDYYGIEFCLKTGHFLQKHSNDFTIWKMSSFANLDRQNLTWTARAFPSPFEFGCSGDN